MTIDLDEALTGADLVVETIVEEVEPKRGARARGGSPSPRDPDHEHVVALGGRGGRRAATARALRRSPLPQPAGAVQVVEIVAARAPPPRPWRP